MIETPIGRMATIKDIQNCTLRTNMRVHRAALIQHPEHLQANWYEQQLIPYVERAMGYLPSTVETWR